MLNHQYLSSIVALGWTALVVMLLWLGLFVWTGEQFLIVRWISYLLPWESLFFLLMALLIAFTTKRRLLPGLMLGLAVLMFLPFLPQFIPSTIAVSPDQNIYKVMTYSKMGRNHDMQAVARVIRNEQPDILFVQEISEEESSQLLELISTSYDKKIFWLAHPYFGLIVSRFPVTAEAVAKGASILAARIELPETSLAARNVHLQKSMNHTKAQYTMVNQLANHCAAVTDPLIVAGDFNATIINYPYVRMAQLLDNAYEQAGFGFGFTFPSPARRVGMLTPLMRIDHIFVSQHFTVHEAYVVDDAGESDHYPVVAKVSIKRGGSL